MNVKMTIPFAGPDRRCTSCQGLAFYVFFEVEQVLNEIFSRKFIEQDAKCIDCATFGDHETPSIMSLYEE